MSVLLLKRFRAVVAQSPHRAGVGSETIVGWRWSGLGVHRWVVERTLSWLHNFGRLRIRRERRLDIHRAFVKLGGSLITLNFVTEPFC